MTITAVPNGMSIEKMKARLKAIQTIEFSGHAIRDRIPTRHLNQEEIEAVLRSGEDIVSVEPQENDTYRILFTLNKRRYFSITIRFLTDQTLKVVTAHYVSIRRFNRYQRWLQKKRR